MRDISELINTEEPGWELVQQWINEATRTIEVLPVISKQQAEQVLLDTQVSTRSPMGAIIYETGGILVANGWIRILGSGSEKLTRSISEWNKNKQSNDFSNQPGFLLVADDAIGGYFCINAGVLGKDVGSIYYFAPDSLDFEPLEVNYSQLINFFFSGNIEQFYQDFHWKTEQEDLKSLSPDDVFNFSPPLWTVEGKNLNESIIRPISAEEQYFLNLELRTGLNNIQNIP
ncbi:DUF2625 domain-containing protein [Myroides sp. LoEW2-1]|uniref:DUF2625 domain-containing protein n=1 Tax=Myroides sp. LoEW2-1 TaxID=2683192 RepID=UPI00132243B7|nr:DUF2625 domain-containing protein [Myroides sp. LoEW2-1]MVX35469.1 DUF2625 family protein [Myroides sp. LoEW2-1]